MAVKAVAKGVRLSPRKVAVVADHNHGYKPNTLRITEISVTAGPRIKRYRPAAHGRALPYQKKSSHIRVVVDGDKREVKKPAAKTASKSATEKETK
jgi:large subunit ribosomal protein L22